MTLAAVGLSHHSCPIEIREKLLFAEKSLPQALTRFQKRVPDSGVVILSTCNRVEVYANAALGPDELQAEIRSFLAEWHNTPEAVFTPHLYQHADKQAIGHLFRVASSLDSLVVGEGQILGQVHDAFLLSQTEQATDKIISALFQKAFTVAKNVRTKTNISAGKVSISSVAVDLAVSIFTDLADKTVMVIGSGEMGELTLKSLVSHGVGQVLVVNRSPERAKEVAAEYRGEPVLFEGLKANLHRADIVISSTAAPDFILDASDFQHALKSRAKRPMFAIDIAMPRDIDPAANELDNVYLYDVDGLQEVANANLEARRAEVARCMEIVEDGVEQFHHWMQGLVAEPTIVSMSQELNSIRERELQKTLSALPDLTEKQAEEVAYLSRRIVNAILQRPMSQLKHEVTHHDPHAVLHLVKRLFGLKESP
ncbi:MAG: glutamyl-tRNA reductase [Candidatus Hydrogenedentes bacterium]|nr:glutamyl-tRNA reductase [Candidatus Hydrogenedentota bacterium]